MNIIIGRFQVPKLHPGHLYFIQEAMGAGLSYISPHNVVVLLGCTVNKDDRNPYSFAQRKNLIQDTFPEIQVFPLWDNESDEVWSQQIDGFAESLDFIEDCLLVHSRDSFKDHYKGKIALMEIPELPGFSGTQVRKELEDT